MLTNTAQIPKMTPRRKSMLSALGAGVAGVTLLVAAGAGELAILHQRWQTSAHTEELVGIAGRFLAHGLESPAGKGDLAAMRTMVVLAASESGLRRCRVVESDGLVLADGVPPKVSVRNKGEELLRAEPIPPAELSNPRYANAAISIPLPGKAAVRLELSREVRFPKWTGWPATAALGGTGAAGIGLFGWGFSRLRLRLRGAGAISEALLALGRGETSPRALAVSNKFGADAGAWNQLLAEREQLFKQVSGEKTRESLESKGDVKADLAFACDALWQGMVLVDERLSVKYANGAAAILLRAKRDTMAGASIEQFIHDTTVREGIRSVADGSVRHRTTIELKRPESQGGGVLRFNLRAVRKDDSSASVVITIEDVTQQRVADEARNSFVAQATHELRTPLTNIRLYVEEAIDAGDGDPTKRAKCLDVINHESRRLERIVGDMLSVSEIEAGSFKLRSGDVRLDTVFEELRSDFEAQAKEKQLDLRFELPPKLPAIKGDRDKIVLALHNLIGNALKYTPAGGKVEVKVHLDASNLLVQVVDTGIGISAEEIDLVFEKFYRAKDRRVSDITGTGLGLALAREVVRLHGGDISVRSELDKGSTFTMTVPTLTEAA